MLLDLASVYPVSVYDTPLRYMYTNEGSVISVGSDMMTFRFALLEIEYNS